MNQAQRNIWAALSLPKSTAPIDEEVRRRIRLTVAAYAYEFAGAPTMSDAEFDAECRKVNLRATTGRPDLDEWWRENFNPSTGMWIRAHPELSKVAHLHGLILN